MTTTQVLADITKANASFFRSTAKLIEAADEVKADRIRLVTLLREVTPEIARLCADPARKGGSR